MERQDSSLQTLAVIGAGTMGNGIAQVAAMAGLQVTMIDVSDEAVQRVQAALARSLERLVKKGTLAETDR